MEEHQQEQHQPSSSLSTQYFTLSDNKQTRKQGATNAGKELKAITQFINEEQGKTPMAPATSAGTKRQWD